MAVRVGYLVSVKQKRVSFLNYQLRYTEIANGHRFQQTSIGGLLCFAMSLIENCVLITK